MELTRLRSVREAHGRSLRDVAREAKLDPGHLSRIERGLAKPSVPAFLRITHALGLNESAKAVERVLAFGEIR